MTRLERQSNGKYLDIKANDCRCINMRYGQHNYNGRNGRKAEEKNQRLEEKTILDSILDENIYDARIRPSSLNSSDGPTNIQVNLMIRSVDKIDDVKMEFSVQITFRSSKNVSFHILFLSNSSPNQSELTLFYVLPLSQFHNNNKKKKGGIYQIECATGLELCTFFQKEKRDQNG